MVKKNKPFFIDKTRKKYYDEVACEKLSFCNDIKYLNPKKGVVSVDDNRWKEAQEYEKKIWMKDFKFVADDNDKKNKDSFNNYSALDGKIFDNVIELGCGPFTNLRYILSHIKCKKIDLLDPLIKDYIKKYNCAYKHGLISGDNVWRNRFFGSKKQVNLYNFSIEEFVVDKKYDLIIMINVLEHCKDFEIIKKKILSMSKKGSYFVFSDKIFNLDQIKQNLKNTYDSGHPLRVDKKYLMKFLKDNFRKIYWRTQKIETYRGNRDLSHMKFYYIGEKIF